MGQGEFFEIALSETVLKFEIKNSGIRFKKMEVLCVRQVTHGQRGLFGGKGRFYRFEDITGREIFLIIGGWSKARRFIEGADFSLHFKRGGRRNRW